MGFEDQEAKEKTTSSGKSSTPNMTLQKAVDMGEYDPEYLSTFPEWHTFSRHIQFQYIRQALENRHRHLITQWAEINNMLDYRLKPELRTAQQNVEKQLKKLEDDRERLFLEYSAG